MGEGHGRSRFTYKGQETPRVPLHHASQVPLPQRGRIGNVRFPPQRIAANALLQKIPATIPSASAAPRSRASARRSGAMLFGARSEEHTSELQSLMRISYAVLCLKKKKNKHEQRLTK